MLLIYATLIAACTPTLQKAAMRPSEASTDLIAEGEGATVLPGRDTLQPIREEAGGLAPAMAEMDTTETLAKKSVGPSRVADTAAAAQGRRTLSTAFVRVGPDGHLTVKLKGGRVLVLRDVKMGPRKYCGLQAGSGASPANYCGAYDDVAGAWPGSVSQDR